MDQRKPTGRNVLDADGPGLVECDLSPAGFAEFSAAFDVTSRDDARFAQSVALMQTFSLIDDTSERQRLIEIARAMAKG